MAGCMQHTLAQETPNEAPQPVKEKVFDHYAGVQINGLIRQVLNFSNNTSAAAVNPYLVTYSVNLRKSGWGLRAGVGYQYSSTWANDGITESQTDINDLQARVGIERRFNLSERWSAGVGVDGLYNNNDDYTRTILRSADTVTTVTKSKLPAKGGGLMGWMRYKISPRILIGTEASFYYVTGTESREVSITQKERSLSPPFVFTTVTSVTKSKPTHTDASFRMPVVFYLVVRM